MDRKADENTVDSDDEEDEDFVPEHDDAGSPTGDTEEEGSDGDAEAKNPAPPKPSSATQKKREAGENDGGGKKKRRKDKNAPRRPLSSFMYFSEAEREELKKSRPGLSFKEVGKVVGDRWKTLSKEGKEVYEERARLDKARYREEMKEYRSKGQTMGGGPSGVEAE